ncbi:ABC transporter type 1, transmembrane domain-containing protein [Gautieria morchelliformis]|nr:ABC transporter type 1, transmembrane domain-containing protein [Gautieria morchelliformis]
MSCSELSWADPCTRSYLTSFPPFILISIVLGFYLPLFPKLPAVLKPVFTPFLPLAEAVALIEADSHHSVSEQGVSNPKTPLWRSMCLSGLALAETICWLTIASYRLALAKGSPDYQVISPFLSFLSWLPAAVIPAVRPTLTPPYGLFSLYVVQLVTGVFRFGVIWYDRDTLGVPVNGWDVAGTSANLVAVLALLLIVLCMPLNIPSKAIEEKIGKEVSPEDYTSLWGWISFEWVYPLVRKGTNETLNEPDVWDLSPTMQSKPLYMKFSTTTCVSFLDETCVLLKNRSRKTLLRRLWAVNAMDMVIDFVLMLVSVIFNYARPFFLKRILDSLDPANENNPEARAQGYIYAFLAFFSLLCRAEVDILHLWYGRRVATRIRSELMASIYAKALVRKDYSGIVDKKDGEQEKQDDKTMSTPNSTSKSSETRSNVDKKSKSKDAKGGTKIRSGADVGKIVQLMSGDANRISGTVTYAYFIYGAPFEIIIACMFLYQLLGLSAFAGFLCWAVVAPLNSVLAKQAVGLQKGVLAAGDKRMNVINELLNSVKLVKFYGWENRWMDRVLNARKIELDWLVKGRINRILFSALWTTAPILVSVLSFLTFILTGHELTISVAFTAIAIFNMLDPPLSTLPHWIVQILQSLVAVDRIAIYLSEDEVDAEVSSLMQGSILRSEAIDDHRLGLEHASFKWNAVEEGNNTGPPPVSELWPKPTASVVESEPVPGDSISVSSQEGADHQFELRDISVVFPDRQLTVVTGPTASGKTALLMALLGEMTMLPGDGKLFLPKYPKHVDEYGLAGVSYAAQAPFLQHQSIRDNILFGTPYEEQRYEAVLESCALNPDLAIFEDRDLTEVGSRGISLSGGQKARVALARAVYARSRCVLLDDPLSAVDSHTALFLYERLLRGPLLENRTIVLVTHNVELVLPGAYYLVHMLDGRIDVQGTTEELRKQGTLEAITKNSSLEHQLQGGQTPLDKPSDAQGADLHRRPRQLVEDEARETGSVKWRIYQTYMKASSYWTWAILAVFICIPQLLRVAEKLWIKQWGEAYNHSAAVAHLFYSPSISDGEGQIPLHSSAYISNAFEKFSLSNTVTSSLLPSANDHPLFYVAIYASIGFGTAAISILNVSVQYSGGIRASKLIFKQLLVAVVRATMRWHDSTPTGRMLNRFSEDIQTVDYSISGSLQAINASMATLFASVLTVVFISPPFICPAIVIGYVYYRLAVGYLNTGRDLRRMESNSHSPIYSDFSELLSGIVTVRAFASERRFLDNLHSKIDGTTKMWYFFWMTNRWLSLHFDALGGLAVLFTTLLALSGTIGAGLAGVTITSAMGFTSAVYWTCRNWTQLELDLNSVERVVVYLDLPQEPPLLIESSRPPAYWPSSADNDSLVVVQDLVIRYAADLPPVLHGVSFTLKARERIGLLGRTGGYYVRVHGLSLIRSIGSGKSTLAMSILRFTDPSNGSILIDGIDISTIGLHDLRSRLTFVAQDAVLFSGTIRDNIDPFGDFSDEECMDALYRVHLLSENARTSRRSSREISRASSIHDVERDETVASSSTGSPTAIQQDDKQGTISLHTQVSTGGSNFSQGQRQLFTMAQALLRQSSIIILDEATSSIDYATDAKIQKTIREEFKDSLLITVAHRLRTVIDCDRLIVLENGRIVEFDTPVNLIQKEGGAFRNMCLHSGTFKELEEAANKAAGSTD